MKAFLMYRDRDFDPEQLIVRKEEESRRSRKADQVPDLKPVCRGTSELCGRTWDWTFVYAMARDDDFLVGCRKVAMLQSLTDVEDDTLSSTCVHGLF